MWTGLGVLVRLTEAVGGCAFGWGFLVVCRDVRERDARGLDEKAGGAEIRGEEDVVEVEDRGRGGDGGEGEVESLDNIRT